MKSERDAWKLIAPKKEEIELTYRINDYLFFPFCTNGMIEDAETGVSKFPLHKRESSLKRIRVDIHTGEGYGGDYSQLLQWWTALGIDTEVVRQEMALFIINRKCDKFVIDNSLNPKISWLAFLPDKDDAKGNKINGNQ